MNCTVDAREQLREAAVELRPLQGVISVDVLAPGEEYNSVWTLELVMEDRLQPDMMERLAANDLEVVDVTPQGGHFQARALL